MLRRKLEVPATTGREEDSPASPMFEKGRRNPGDSQNTYSRRIWIGLVAFAALFYFFFPHSYSYNPNTQDRITDTRDLHPQNYLRNLTKGDATPAPFDFCPVYGPGDALGLKYGSTALGRSKIYSGTGTRIQRVIHKALSGRPVTISVLGGSGRSNRPFKFRLV